MLHTEQADGSTLKQNLENVYRMTGKKPPELEIEPIPDCLVHVWHWFLQLNSQRTSKGFGVNPITNQDMWFFFQLEGIEPESWELDLIRKFDQVALQSYSKQRSTSEKADKTSRTSKTKR